MEYRDQYKVEMYANVLRAEEMMTANAARGWEVVTTTFDNENHMVVTFKRSWPSCVFDEASKQD